MTIVLSMFIYFATFLSSILIYRYSLACKKKTNKRVFLFIAVCIPCITAALRTSGADLKTYFEYYDIIKEINFKSGREPLWVIVNWLSPTKHWMLFFTSMIFLCFSMGSIEYFVKKSKSMAWSIVLLVFYSTFLNIMRQMIAVAIITYFFKYLFKKKYLAYFVGIAIAACFHRSSAIMAVTPVILFFAKRLRHYDVLIFILAVLMPLLTPFIFKALELLNFYTKYVHNISFNFQPQFILCMLPPTFLYYITGGRKKHSAIVNNLFYIYLVSFPIQTFGFMAQYVDRMTYNFYFTVCLFVPMIVDEIGDVALRRKTALFMDSWFLIYYIGVFAVVGTATVYPYIDYNKRKLFYGR